MSSSLLCEGVEWFEGVCSVVVESEMEQSALILYDGHELAGGDVGDRCPTTED